MHYPSVSLERAIGEFSKLPGIGRKSAQRLVFFLLKNSKYEVQQLAEALIALKEKVKFCSTCFNITEAGPCHICLDERRDQALLCVVEEANDVLALEKTGEYKGLYHVLGGALSPLEGVGPDDLHIKEMLTRFHAGIGEVIIATNPNTEGEATALYLHKLLHPLGLKITKLAHGLPVGGQLEYTDRQTINLHVGNRVEMT